MPKVKRPISIRLVDDANELAKSLRIEWVKKTGSDMEDKLDELQSQALSLRDGIADLYRVEKE